MTERRAANDPKIAVALRYAWGERAPTAVASGKGALAERLVDAALAHGVPVHEDTALAELLAKVPVGTTIPPAAFLAVAQVLSFLVEVDRRLGEDQAVRR
jgi:flagellar biosynthesis protein